MTVRCAALLMILALPLLAGAQGPSGSALADGFEGERLFLRSCASCHGPAGEGGKGPALAVPGLPRAPDLETLSAVIRRGIEGTEMPGIRFTDAELSVLAEWVLGLGQRPMEQLPGDPARGQHLYATKGGCASCHAIHGRGGVFGPDLSDIGRRRGAPHLRESLLEPDPLWRFQTGAHISADPISFEVDGRQHVAISAGQAIFAFAIRQSMD